MYSHQPHHHAVFGVSHPKPGPYLGRTILKHAWNIPPTQDLSHPGSTLTRRLKECPSAVPTLSPGTSPHCPSGQEWGRLRDGVALAGALGLFTGGLVLVGAAGRSIDRSVECSQDLRFDPVEVCRRSGGASWGSWAAWNAWCVSLLGWGGVGLLVGCLVSPGAALRWGGRRIAGLRNCDHPMCHLGNGWAILECQLCCEVTGRFQLARWLS